MVIYACIKAFIAQEKWPPSNSELIEMSNYSKGSVTNYLMWLETHGYIERGQNNEPRTIRIVNRENRL